ncbi:MAG: hypothetical protein KDD69_01295 [Bdellovibrionales bacterium]|nr:hypothetical protein [Bdellovibrionales bacterium]
MFALLLRHILKRTLTIPLTWGLIYPTLTGDVIVLDIRLGKPPALATPIASVGRASIDLRWSTVFDDYIQADVATFEEVQVQLDAEEASKFVWCLQDSTCASPAERLGRDAQPAAQPESAGTRKQSSPRPPLRLAVERFEVLDGALLVRSDKGALRLDVAHGEGGPLKLPLEEGDVQVTLDLFASSLEGQERVPVRAKVTWEAQTRKIRVSLLTRDFPAALLQPLLGSSPLDGTLQGEIQLEHDPQARSGSRWRVVS